MNLRHAMLPPSEYLMGLLSQGIEEETGLQVICMHT